MMKNYLSMVKFSHTIFAMPFALIGVFWGFQYMKLHGLELEKPFWQTLILVIICMVTARNAAMGFNRYVDRDIDAKNARTVGREIPAGKISPKHAMWFVAGNSLAFILTSFIINPLCFYLSPVALMVILGYSYTKRFTSLCHMVLGLGLSLAPVGAFLAITGAFKIEPIVLGLGVLTWVGGFDIIYALQDKEFDQENDLSSIPAFLGKRNALVLSACLHLITSGMIIWFGVLISGGILYAIGAGAFILLLIYQHLLVTPNDQSKVNLAFFTTNGIASLVFAIFAIGEWWI